MNLFNIDKQLEAIYAEIEDNDGEISPELEEALAITEANFRSKVQSYCELVKQVEYDVESINNELNRLKDLKERKQRSVESIKKILSFYVSKYGDLTKSGNKFIDYGIGKVSVRNTKQCEVNELLVDGIANGLFSYLNALSYNGQLNCTDGIDEGELFKALQEYTNNKDLCKEDIDNISTAITFNLPISALTKSDGYRFIGNFINYIKEFKCKNTVNKNAIKQAVEDGTFVNIGTVKTNTSVQIK